MDEKKIIAVIGATGAQGGGLCRAILKDVGGGYRVRALTRNAGSGKAEELKRLGAEVVEVDVDDAESLKRAFRGAHGVFCVTFFWEHFSPEKELAEAKNMADAAKHAGVRHVICRLLKIPGSGFPSTTPECRPSWRNTRFRTSTPRARPTGCSPNEGSRRRSC